MLLLSSCLGTRHLKENERLLYIQQVKASKGVNVDHLKDLYAQKANRKILGTPLAPLVSIHYLGKRFYNPKKYEKKIARVEAKYDRKIAKTKSDRKLNNLQFNKQTKLAKFNDRIQNGNQVMQWGEPVAVFDTVAFNTTLARFKEYLFSKGYFQSEIETKFTSIQRLVRVKYVIKAGKPYVLDSIFFQIGDSAVFNLIHSNQKGSFLVKGENFDQQNFNKERERIDILMKDNGYYDFSRQYIEYNIDTAFREHRKVAVQLIINEPAKRSYHKKFSVEEVNFTPDAGVTSTRPARRNQLYRNINFHFFENYYSKKVLSQRVFIAPGTTYSRKKTFDTQRQLANLNNFKFVNIVYDTSGGHFIANIYTSPLDRYQWSNEIGLSVTQGYPGPFYNVNFLKRNIFRGFENFEMNGRIGYEGVAAATSETVYTSTEASINASITFPQFVFPLREDKRYELGKVNPKTKIQVGYTYTDRPEYQRAATSINYTYSWENKRIRRYDLTVANVSIINSSTSEAFQNFLQTQYNDLGNTLIFSFNPSFVSSMIFAMTWNHNSYGSADRSSAFVRWAIESGGTFQNIFDFSAVERNNLQTFKYLRAHADLRRIKIINKTTVLAYRINGGIAYSYDSRDVLPYEKYFFVGGSNSVRAWRPRRLGQGSFRPPISADIEKNGYFDYRFEKPGDIALEGSVELRKKLFGFVEGAIFLDAGNVWTFKPLVKRDEESNLVENGNSQFKVNEFYKEFGIGTGFGWRFNFSFLIIRFDVGMKVYDPAREKGDRFVLDGIRPFKPFGVNHEPIIYNIGIGYPF